MREYFYMIGEMDYMLNEKSRHQPRHNQQQAAARETRETPKSILLVRLAMLIALSKLLTK